jgi:FAD/FMN-containing dehydrogenase
MRRDPPGVGMETDARAAAVRAIGAVPDDAAERLRADLDGDLVTPADPGYDDARRVWNGLVNRYPAAVAYCESVPDVRAAVAFARERDLPASARGAGHDVAGKSVAAAGLVVDCSRLDWVRVDPERRTARVGPGATWADLDRTAAAHGLATPGGVVSETGVVGLTLGGGTGYLTRKHGLACDNLRSADVLAADGSLRVADAEANADLFWALRGGGAPPGVVTALEFDLHPLPDRVATVDAWYPAERAADLLAAYRDYAAEAPPESCVSPYVATVPADSASAFPAEFQGAPALVFYGAWAGDPDAGAERLTRFREFDGKLADFSGSASYVDLQSSMDADFPAGRRYYWKSVYADGLGDDVIDCLRERGAAAPSPLSALVVWPMGGAVAEVDASATAVPHRDADYVLNFEACWDDPMATEENVRWAREGIEALRELGCAGIYANFAGTETDPETERAAHGAHLDRLRAVAREYDPDGVFARER